MATFEKLAPPGSAAALFEEAGLGLTSQRLAKGTKIYGQGAPSEMLFFLLKGRVKLSVVSGNGKEAIVAIMSDGDIFGESCLLSTGLYPSMATALTDCSLLALQGSRVRSAIQRNPVLAESMMNLLLLHRVRAEETLANHLIRPCEARLARALILLAETTETHVIEGITQEDLACLVGTTRSRISFFMNKFRRLGCVEFTDRKSYRVLPSRLKRTLEG